MDYKVAIGLGNPGEKYRATRHNIGFEVIDYIYTRWRSFGWTCNRYVQFSSVASQGMMFYLVKPVMYMNLSGVAIDYFLKEKGVLPSEMVVIHDDLDLDRGRIKIKHAGGNAGHKGLDSICESVGTRDFTRIRIGIGRPAIRTAVVDYVLERPTDPEELSMRQLSIILAGNALEVLVYQGLKSAMDQYNQRDTIRINRELSHDTSSEPILGKNGERGNFSENI